MKVYSKLLLEDGGGIISPYQQAEHVENEVNIFIGLGGTGIDCLREIKTQVYLRLKPDKQDIDRKEYSNIRFLGVDCDFSHNKKTLEDIITFALILQSYFIFQIIFIGTNKF